MRFLGIFIIIILSISFFAVASQDEIDVMIIKNPDFKGKIGKNFGLSSDSEVKIKNKYSSFDGISAKVTKEEYEKIKNDERYLIFKDKKYHILLDSSAPQINADDAWNLQYNLSNITGTNQAICIIDTGINYSHSAFGNCYGNNSASSNCTVIGGWDFVNDDSDPLDDNGHGSYVAGIVASQDSTYRGVSYGSKLIIIKALDNLGSGGGDDVAAGIDWCVNNATAFNISVISMSLGDDNTYNSYCNNDALNTPISAAIARNITVVVAAGNCDRGNQPSCIAGISSPACVENATAIGAVYDNDTITFMRGNLFELMAPGKNIISVDYDGSFSNPYLTGGTSFSTPHVAGVVALMQQFAKSQNGNLKTPNQIEVILNSTGLVINDTSGTNLNFTRVDAYNAILSMDGTSPNVTLSSPTNSLITSDTSINFTCNTSDWQLANVSLFVWNNTRLYYNETRNISGATNSTTFNVSNMTSTTYSWNCKAFDSLGNNAFASSNFSVTTGGVLIELISPSNNTKTNVASKNYTCNATTENSKILSNITFYIWNSTGSLIQSNTTNYSGIENTSIINYTFSSEGNYSWNCKGVNNVSNSSFSTSNYSIGYDATRPVISNENSTVTSNSATITWTTNELTNSFITGDFISTDSSYTLSHSITIDDLNPSRTYDYVITSCDEYGNCESSSGLELTTSSASSGGGGGGGGGSSSVQSNFAGQFLVKDEDVRRGVQRLVSKGEEIVFNVSNERHTLKLIAINGNITSISIQSQTVFASIKANEEKKFNLSSPSYYDLYVKIISVGASAANIFIQEINEEIPTPVVVISEENQNSTQETEEKIEEIKPKSRFFNWKFLVFIALAAFILFYIIEKLFFSKRLKKARALKNKEKKKKSPYAV